MGRFTLNGRGLFWLCLILLHNIAIAQNFSPRFRKFSNAEGLSQSVVISVFQDSKNFLWFGTEDGLNKFDGFTFKVYRFDPEDSSSISDNWIQHIYMEDSDGDLWMETGDGNINVFSPRTDRFVKIVPSDSATGFLPFRKIYFINQDRNNWVWISTDRGLFTVSKSDWKISQLFVNREKVKPRIFLHFMDDNQENVWLGSNNGLATYNYKIKGASDSLLAEKLPNKAIQGIQQLNDKTWVITEGEIVGYNHPKSYHKIISFNSLLSRVDDGTGMRRLLNMFAFVRKDSQDNLWIGTQKGLLSFGAKSEKVSIYLHNPADKSSLPSDYITKFYEDKNGNFWVGTTKGVSQFIPGNNSFRRFGLNSDSLTNTRIVNIFEDKTGRIWLKNQSEQAEGSQLFYLDNKTEQFIQAKKRNHNPEGMPVDMVYDPFIDHQGNLWFGTYGSGVILYSPFQKKFELIRHYPEISNTPAGNSVWGMSEDSQGRLWIALFQDGLDCYDPATGKTIHYKEKLRAFTGSRNFNVITAVCDDQNRVWIGTTGQGMICLEIASGKMTQYLNNPKLENHTASNFILAITKDREANLVISTPNAGLDLFNPKTGRFTNLKNVPGDSNSLFNNYVRYAIGTSDGNYWISCDGAISFYNPKEKIMKHYASLKNKGKGILTDKASCIFEDSKGNIWIGTHGGGLSLFDRKKEEFRYWVEKDGLINNVIYGILEDNNSNLWISTNNGISCFNPEKNTFKNYYVNDGLQAGEFNANSFHKSQKGKMYFGGINGITTFFPDDIQPDPVPPKVAITGFQIYNKKVEVLPFDKRTLSKGNENRIIERDDHLYLTENIAYAKKLKLRYNYKVFTFEFAALRYDMPERCTYMYKMEGFENDWNLAGNRRFASYTNLPPGKYVFKVTAANADGIWNPEPARIEIEIIPPFYLTWWFISFVVASLILASTSFVVKREKNLKRTRQFLEEKVKLRTRELNEKNEELTLRNIQILKQKEEIAHQAKRLKVELDFQNQASEQALLRSQINPHFLFNTLNNIYSLVYQKASNAPEALMKLSEIMRYMLYDTSADMVQLDKEIQYLKSFIELHQLRLKNKDFVSFDIAGDTSGKQIAPMLLIAFIENAFKHGNKSTAAPGIVIQLNCSKNEIRFNIKNSKNISSPKDSLGGIGLANVKRRLELIYHDKYHLNINDSNDTFEVDLLIHE
jgi:ligand-binding sensor domain-containing protein